jgi:hypothetical protein
MIKRNFKKGKRSWILAIRNAGLLNFESIREELKNSLLDRNGIKKRTGGKDTVMK